MGTKSDVTHPSISHKMTTPIVSVLVPVFNGGSYLDEALASIATQTFTDFEVIISDDCSTDNSLDIARNWEIEDSRFRLRVNERNLGMTVNWNAALSNARGEYIVKLDCDDVMRSRCLEELVEQMRTCPDVFVTFCRTLSCDEHLEPHSSYLGDAAMILHGLNPLQEYKFTGHIWYQMSFSDIQLWGSNAQIHRRESLLALGGWDSTWGCGSDTDLILRVLEQGKLISHRSYAGILYRHRQDSVSDTYKKNGWLLWEALLIHLLSLTRYYKNGNRLTSQLRKEWWRYWNNLQRLRAASDLSGFPEIVQVNISKALKSLTPPPTNVLVEGHIRQKLWQIKQRILN